MTSSVKIDTERAPDSELSHKALRLLFVQFSSGDVDTDDIGDDDDIYAGDDEKAKETRDLQHRYIDFKRFCTLIDRLNLDLSLAERRRIFRQCCRSSYSLPRLDMTESQNTNNEYGSKGMTDSSELVGVDNDER